jgi:hypothetical protein
MAQLTGNGETVAFETVGGIIQIGASVGRGAVNRTSDVRVIQSLLNQKMQVARLAVTGICDAPTISAIEIYQRRTVGISKPDGRVDPNGVTIRSLSGVPNAPNPPPNAMHFKTSVLKPTEMRDTAWTYLLEFTTHHEYPVYHMYNNRTKKGAKDDVTCGIGHFLESPDAAKKIKHMFFDKNTRPPMPATDEQIEHDWDAAAKLTRMTDKENNLNEYGNICILRMYPNLVYDDMAETLKQKLKTLLTYPRCKDDFADFVDFPAAAQIFSVSFAYGHIPGVPTKKHGKHESDYPAMRAFIKATEWSKAATECRLNNGSEAKNNGHRRLLEFAQYVKDEGLDFNLVPPMFR